MKLLFSDGVSMGRGGPIQLLRLDNKWYVTGPGFMCSVDQEEEGKQLIEALEAARARGESLYSCLQRPR